MTRYRKSSGEWCFSFDAFKALGFKRACETLGLDASAGRPTALYGGAS